MTKQELKQQNADLIELLTLLRDEIDDKVDDLTDATGETEDDDEG